MSEVAELVILIFALGLEMISCLLQGMRARLIVALFNIFFEAQIKPKVRMKVKRQVQKQIVI